MIVALLGLLLVLGGAYILTQHAPFWHQVFMAVERVASVLHISTWHRVEYFSAIAAVVLGAALLLRRLLGGYRHA